MKKVLICYQILVVTGSNQTSVDGHCFVDVQRLTRTELERCCGVIMNALKEQWKAQNPIMWAASEFRGPTLRSVTLLEDGPDEGLKRALEEIPSSN